jgi:protein required for attachment to host cells
METATKRSAVVSNKKTVTPNNKYPHKEISKNPAKQWKDTSDKHDQSEVAQSQAESHECADQTYQPYRKLAAPSMFAVAGGPVAETTMVVGKPVVKKTTKSLVTKGAANVVAKKTMETATKRSAVVSNKKTVTPNNKYPHKEISKNPAKQWKDTSDKHDQSEGAQGQAKSHECADQTYQPYRKLAAPSMFAVAGGPVAETTMVVGKPVVKKTTKSLVTKGAANVVAKKTMETATKRSAVVSNKKTVTPNNKYPHKEISKNPAKQWKDTSDKHDQSEVAQSQAESHECADQTYQPYRKLAAPSMFAVAGGPVAETTMVVGKPVVKKTTKSLVTKGAANVVAKKTMETATKRSAV